MNSIGTIPYADLRLDKDGEREDPAAQLVPFGTTDLIVVSHGWKNSDGDADFLYRTLIANVIARSDGAMTGGDRRYAVVGVKWPAFRYQPDLTLLPADDGVADVAAAAAGSNDLSRAQLAEFARSVAADLGLSDPTKFVDQALAASGGGGAANTFLDSLRDGLSTHPDGEVAEDHSEFLTIEGSDAVEALKERIVPPPAAVTDDAEGGAAGLGDVIGRTGARFLRGGKAAIATLLNQATYYEMKTRAGKVGRALAKILEKEHLETVRVHLVGHSFGARLVTAAAAGSITLPLASMSLVQGAYSHNGLGTGVGPNKIDGVFRRVVADKLVSGPILVTRSIHDSAVGFFYALASKISGDIATGFGVRDVLGGPNDLHGGLGANGALKLHDEEWIGKTATPDTFPDLEEKLVNNVLADTIIAEHNDVANINVAALVWRAVKFRPA